ncbi:MAG: hypothetical protein QOE10_276 [Gaiellales bacterium]|nr:hypothetical protein [Gaiellales bacterium]
MRISLARSVLVAAVLVPAWNATASARASATIAHPTGADVVVIRTSTGGGFVAPQASLGAVPSFTLYGDGTIVIPGAVPQISPGPAIKPLLRRHLSERQVQALLRGAKQAGLLAAGTIDYGDMGSVGVSDMPTTTLIVHAAGRRVTRQAYALGVTGRTTPAQAKARSALSGFIATLPRSLAGVPYVPRALAVYVTSTTAPGQPGSAPITWPLSSDLATAGASISSGPGYRCITVSGGNARTLLATLRTANDQSLWKSSGAPGRYLLIARPLLPDERSCASLRQ